MVTTSSAALAKYVARRLAEESPRRRRSGSRPWGPSFKDDSAEVGIFSSDGSVSKDGSVLTGDFSEETFTSVGGFTLNEPPPLLPLAETRSEALAPVGRFDCMREESGFMGMAPGTALITHSIEPFAIRRPVWCDSEHFRKRAACSLRTHFRETTADRDAA